MNNPDSRPVLVTGEERAHPAVRILARACIALAQERIAEQKQAAVETADETGEDTRKEAAKETGMPERAGTVMAKESEGKKARRREDAGDATQGDDRHA